LKGGKKKRVQEQGSTIQANLNFYKCKGMRSKNQKLKKETYLSRETRHLEEKKSIER